MGSTPAERAIFLKNIKTPANGKSDDALVRVRPMLDRVDRWNAYLSDAVKLDKEELIERHARTGRPFGNPGFIHKLEIITGEELAPKRPGSKSTASK